MPKQRRPQLRSTAPRSRPVRPRVQRRYHPFSRRTRTMSARQGAQAARATLRRYRQGSLLVVGITAMLILVWGAPEATHAQEPEAPGPVDLPTDPTVEASEATQALRDLLQGAWALLPRVAIAAICLAVAWLLVRLLRVVLRRALGGWGRGQAVTAMMTVVVWLFGLGAALGVLAGDARALVGSVGLAGLALSWALQAPIESFTGWLLNNFQGYYRIGDRIAVGEVFGDVYRIDVLTTTVWEAGGPDKPVRGAQPTGALITFPNSDVLRANIVNYTREFPYVWDEVTVSVAEEGDLTLALRVARDVAQRVVGPAMAAPVGTYVAMLQRVGLSWDVAVEPEVFAAPGDYWANLTVRYLVPARQRRRWSSALYLALVEALGEHAQQVPSAAVRARVSVPPPLTPPEGAPAAAEP